MKSDEKCDEGDRGKPREAEGGRVFPSSACEADVPLARNRERLVPDEDPRTHSRTCTETDTTNPIIVYVVITDGRTRSAAGPCFLFLLEIFDPWGMHRDFVGDAWGFRFDDATNPTPIGKKFFLGSAVGRATASPRD